MHWSTSTASRIFSDSVAFVASVVSGAPVVSGESAAFVVSAASFPQPETAGKRHSARSSRKRILLYFLCRLGDFRLICDLHNFQFFFIDASSIMSCASYAVLCHSDRLPSSRFFLLNLNGSFCVPCLCNNRADTAFFTELSFYCLPFGSVWLGFIRCCKLVSID